MRSTAVGETPWLLPITRSASCRRCCSTPLAAGDRPQRCPDSMPGDRRAIRGRRYPADPPTVTEIVAVMRQAGNDHHGQRLRALIVVLWRAGLRIHEALALNESDLDARRGSVLVRRGKGGRRRQVGMDDWAWEQLEPWLKVRVELPVGPLFCIISGPIQGRAWSTAAACAQLRDTAARAASAGASRRTSSATPTPSKWPRRRAATRHPTATRTHQPRHHLDLPTRHRQRRDHRHRPRPTPSHGPRRQHATTLTRVLTRRAIAAAWAATSVPTTAMRTRVRAPLATSPLPSQVAVQPNAPQRPLGAGGGAVADLLFAALHLPQRSSAHRSAAVRRRPRASRPKQESRKSTASSVAVRAHGDIGPGSLYVYFAW
jgi:integrase